MYILVLSPLCYRYLFFGLHLLLLMGVWELLGIGRGGRERGRESVAGNVFAAMIA